MKPVQKFRKCPGTYVFFILLSFLATGCSQGKTDYYHRFNNQVWQRFNILSFEVPVEKTGVPYDILFFAHHTKEYEYDNLDFNMVMTTPSGEERIREYTFTLKRYGSFTGKCNGDSCEAVIPVKTDITFSKKGILKIEIENLVPRLEIKGLLGVGIRIVPKG